MLETSNYGLKKPEGADAVSIDDLNYNADIVDVKIKEAIDKADQAFQSASDGKQEIATAVTGKGVPASGSDTFTQLATKIGNIVTDPSVGTTDAVASEILSGKKAVSQGNMLTGTMPNRGAVSQNLTAEGQEYTIPSGYHNGLGKIKAVITGLVASVIKAGTTAGGILGTFTSDATATAAQMLAGAIAYVNGNKVTGTMVNRGAVVITPSTANQAISNGYHNGSGYVAGSANLVPENIKNGVNIFGKVGTLKEAPTVDINTGLSPLWVGSDGQLDAITHSLTYNAVFMCVQGRNDYPCRFNISATAPIYVSKNTENMQQRTTFNIDTKLYDSDTVYILNLSRATITFNNTPYSGSDAGITRVQRYIK